MRKISIIAVLAIAALWMMALTTTTSATTTRIQTKTVAVAAKGQLRPGVRLTAPAVYKHHRVTRYQWLRCNARGKSCNAIHGAVHRTYVIRSADVGHTLRTHIQASTIAVSDPTPLVGRPAPVNTARPVITDGGQGGGTLAAPIVGDILTGSNGTWQHAVRFTYLWEDCDATGANCVGITGATANTYTLQDTDAGHTIVFQVTAYNF